MQVVQNRNSIGHLSVLTALWFINILIVIFGAPFLIFKKAQEVILKTFTNSGQKEKTKQKSARYFPCRIDSKF
jgi:hypothetical protein